MSHSHSISDYPGQIVGIAAISAIAGALTALMLAPKTGEDMRGSLKNRAASMKDKVVKPTGDFPEAMQDTKERMTETIDAVKSAGKETAKDIKNVANKDL